MTPLREFTMIRFMDEITDKQNWHIHVNDPAMIEKWKEGEITPEDDMTPKMFDWCIDELRYKASLIPQDSTDQQPPLFVFHGDVFKSDTALSVEFKTALQEEVAKYGHAIPENLKDHRPGSDGKLWDLVHPSLFPLVCGRTRVLGMGSTNTTLADCLERSGEGSIIKYPGKSRVKRQLYADELPFSEKFQWLPCEVDIFGDDPRITSYINNLHPSEKSLYGLLEKVIKASISLWDFDVGTRSDSDDESESEDENGGEQSSRPDIRPEPNMPFRPPASTTGPGLKDKYGNLQVIVQLTNIELTPEQGSHEDNFWHIDTPLNEHIVARSMYVYSCSNITRPAIGFRQIFPKEDSELDRDYRPNDPRWLSIIYGVEQEDLATQIPGAVSIPEGRLLTYPNTLQYSIEPVELEDLSRPGHLKFVTLYLVDPNIKIISTAHVPCQRQDWLEGVVNRHSSGSSTDFPISLQDAKTLQEENLKERSDFEGEFESAIEIISREFY